MLAETVVYLQPVYLVSWGAIGFVLGLIACVVLSSKGHTREGIAALLLGLVCFPFGLIALLVALSRPDKRLQQGHAPAPPRRPPPVMTRRRRQELAAAEAERMASVPQFVQCLRCGETNNASLTACWKCGQSFLPEPPQVVAAPPAVDSGDATPIMPTPAAPDLGAHEIKVRCKACGKRYSGTVANIARMKACPRCKATPFDAETVSP